MLLAGELKYKAILNKHTLISISYRLYYLYQGPTMGCIKEESLMQILYWLSPILGGIFTTSHMVENTVYDNSYLFHYSYCGKTSFSPEIVYNLFITNSCAFLTTLSILSEFLAHILILVKKTNIESRAQVYEIRGNRLVCQMRHQRNVVSALGHFFSFTLSIVQRIIFTVALYAIEEDKVVSLARLLMFLLPCINFFLHPFIETLSTHNLRQTMSMHNLCQSLFT